LNLNSRNQARRGLIIYNTTNGITTLKKHAMYTIFILFFSEKKKNKMNSLREDERQPSKKRPNMSTSSISKFFAIKEPFKRKRFEEQK
jgi:hypothetical protein